MSDNELAILLLIFSGLVIVFGWLLEQLATRHRETHKKIEPK